MANSLSLSNSYRTSGSFRIWSLFSIADSLRNPLQCMLLSQLSAITICEQYAKHTRAICANTQLYSQCVKIKKPKMCRPMISSGANFSSEIYKQLNEQTCEIFAYR
jgi:hypothetical protein